MIPMRPIKVNAGKVKISLTILKGLCIFDADAFLFVPANFPAARNRPVILSVQQIA